MSNFCPGLHQDDGPAHPDRSEPRPRGGAGSDRAGDLLPDPHDTETVTLIVNTTETEIDLRVQARRPAAEGIVTHAGLTHRASSLPWTAGAHVDLVLSPYR